MLIKSFFHGLLITCTCFLPVIALGIFYLVIGNAFSHHYLHAKLIDAHVVRSCGPVPCHAYNLREIFQISGTQNCSLYRRQEFTDKETAVAYAQASVVLGSEREIWSSWDNPHICYDVASKDYFTLVGSVLLSVFPGFPLAVLIIILLLNLFLLVWQQLVKLTRVQQQAEPVDDLSLESGMKEQELTVKTEKSLERTTLVEEVSYSRVSSGTDMEEVTTPSQFDDSEV
jgi:hypothetical protein